MIDLRKEISLSVTEEFEKEVVSREQVKTTLDEVIINANTLDKNKVYILKEGVLVHLKNDSFRLYFYKDKVDKFTNIYFYEIVNAQKGETNLRFTSELAYKILGKQYKETIKKNIVTVKERNNDTKIDFNINCWECGSLLDINGNCEICGCSKEI